MALEVGDGKRVLFGRTGVMGQCLYVIPLSFFILLMYLRCFDQGLLESRLGGGVFGSPLFLRPFNY